MKRKSMGLFMAVILTICCSGCSNEESIAEAFSLYTETTADINGQEGLSMTLFGTMTTDYDDTQSMLSVSGYFTRQGDASTGVLSLGSLTNDTVDYHFAGDGEVYLTYTDKSTDELSKEEYDSLVAFQNLPTISEKDMIKSCDIEENETSEGDSTKDYTLSLNPEDSEQIATDILEAFGFIDTDTVPVDFDVKEMECKISVDEQTGSPILFQYVIDTDMEAEDDPIHVIFKMNYYLTAVGDEVSVSVSDLSQYLDE